MTQHPYSGLEPEALWKHFAALNDIPRPSGEEEAAREYVRHIATAHGCEHRTDARGNIVVYVPATRETSAAPLAIQAHLDMVCQQRPQVEHDWSRDPVKPRREGNRIYASGTTLGADNGIGAAAMLAILTTPNLQHGPLELVFTIEEETGLFGAAELDASLVSARQLINLDSEDPDEITIGCAGGSGLTLQVPLETEPTQPDDNLVAREVSVHGLTGGHSGVQIHEQLANAIKLLTEVLRECRAAIDFRLAGFNGGTAHNAIPRDAAALVVLSPRAGEELTQAIALLKEKLCAIWCDHEPRMEFDVRDAELPAQVWSEQSTQCALDLLGQLPHGVLRMSEEFVGKVETSTNLAKVESSDTTLDIATSSRSFRAAELKTAQQNIRTLGEHYGAAAEERDGYPGWEPNPDSPLLQTTKRVYETVHGQPPKVEIIHAGLECGVLAERLPGLDAVSLGPLIRGPHSPEEYVEISSVEDMWKMLTALLAELAE